LLDLATQHIVDIVVTATLPPDNETIVDFACAN
jgi:hypothetical protein